MSRCKILHICKYYYPYAGGIEDVCYNIVNILKQDPSVDQKIICFNDVNSSITELHEGIEVTRVGIKGVFASQPLSISYYMKLKKIIKGFRPDYIHFHAPNPLVMLILLSILPKQTKLITHWHSDIYAQKTLYRLIEGIERRLLQRSDTIIVTSKNYLTHSKPLEAYHNKSIVIPNVIHPEKFELTKEREKQVASIKQQYQNKSIILFVGRHCTYKGLEYLIKSVPKITHNCVVLIGGKGELTDALKALNKSENVEFVGRINDDMLAAYYWAADIFVFPSITKNEAFGVALAEAMYCNTVPITFSIEGSGVNWVNQSGVSGLEVENSNSDQLAQAIDSLLADVDIRQQMAEQAHQRVCDNFLIKTIEKEVMRLYSL